MINGVNIKMVNAFETEIQAELKQLGIKFQDFFWYRISDTKSFRQISERMFMLKQPADFVTLFKGSIYFMELKSSHNKTSFSLRYIKSHQLASLIKVEKAGGNGFFLINDRSRRGDFKCYAVRATYIAAYIASSTKKSITWKELNEHSLLIPRTKGQRWNLDNLFRILR